MKKIRQNSIKINFEAFLGFWRQFLKCNGLLSPVKAYHRGTVVQFWPQQGPVIKSFNGSNQRRTVINYSVVAVSHLRVGLTFAGKDWAQQEWLWAGTRLGWKWLTLKLSYNGTKLITDDWKIYSPGTWSLYYKTLRIRNVRKLNKFHSKILGWTNVNTLA